MLQLSEKKGYIPLARSCRSNTKPKETSRISKNCYTRSNIYLKNSAQHYVNGKEISAGKDYVSVCEYKKIYW